MSGITKPGDSLTEVLVGGKKPEQVIADHQARQRVLDEERRVSEEMAERERREAQETFEREQKRFDEMRESARKAGASGLDQQGHQQRQPAVGLPPQWDIFGIEDIIRTPELNYQFIGLETPDGRWDTITLDGSLFDNGAKRNQAEWIKYSDEQPEYHITPMRVRYWMMRAVVDLAATRNPRQDQITTILDLRRLFLQDMQVTATDNLHLTHNADVICFPDHITPDAVETLGWPRPMTGDHPFSRTRTAHIYGANPTAMRSGKGIEELLYAVVGDGNPERVAQVIRWYIGEIVPWPQIARPTFKVGGPRCVYLYSQDEPCLSLGSSPEEQKLTARGVRADPADFHPLPPVPAPSPSVVKP